MISFPVVNEACRLLAEGIAVKAADLDIASVMGTSVMFWFAKQVHVFTAIKQKP